MNSAPAYRARLRAFVARYGEAFDLTHAGAVTSLTGVFGIAGPDTLTEHFDPATASGLTRPVLALTLDGDAQAPEVNDTLTRDGRTLTVRAVDVRRVSGTTVGFFALLD